MWFYSHYLTKARTEWCDLVDHIRLFEEFIRLAKRFYIQICLCQFQIGCHTEFKTSRLLNCQVNEIFNMKWIPTENVSYDTFHKCIKDFHSISRNTELLQWSIFLTIQTSGPPIFVILSYTCTIKYFSTFLHL